MDRLPFTEMWEVVQKEWVRDGATDTATEAKYKSHINYIYSHVLPLNVDEEHIRKEAFITTVADYSTGTVDISAAGTTADEGDTAVSWTSAITNGALFKQNDYDSVLRVDYTSGAQLTFQNSATWVHAAVDEGSYRVVFDRYSLASDFGYMMIDQQGNGRIVYYDKGGGKVFLDPLTTAQFEQKFYFGHGEPSEYTVKKDFASDTYYLYINPPDTSTRLIRYAYVPKITYMTEYTTGTCTFAASTALVGSGTLWSTALDTTAYTYYIRNDTDGTGSESLWFKIASTTDATHATLSTTFTGTAAAGANYTIATIPKYPMTLDTVIMAGAALLADPDNKEREIWMGIFKQGLESHMAKDNRRIIGVPFSLNVGRG